MAAIIFAEAVHFNYASYGSSSEESNRSDSNSVASTGSTKCKVIYKGT